MKTDTKELAAQLRGYNAWRRGYQISKQPHPIDIGKMIDAAADRLEELQSDCDSWQNMAHSRKLQADAARRELAARKEACR
jgi:hypothetical protein